MENSFDRMASTFDTDYRVRRAAAVSESIGGKIDMAKKQNVLELGCGTGLVTLRLMDRIGRLTLVDSSVGMLNRLGEKLRALDTAKDIRIYGDLFSSAIPPLSYDFIYSSMVLHHIRDTDSCARRFHELLIPGGHACVVDLTPVDALYHAAEPDFDGYHGFVPDDLVGRFERHGFFAESCDIIYRDSKLIEGRDIPYSLFMVLLRKRDPVSGSEYEAQKQEKES